MSAPTIPQALEAERALLGGLLLAFQQVDAIAELLAPRDFYTAAHARLFAFLVGRAAKAERVDVLGLADYLEATGQEEAFGGLAYVTSLPERCPSTVNLEAYAQLVRAAAIRRRYLELAQDLAQQVYAGAPNLEDLADLAERRLAEITQETSTQDLVPLAQILDTEWARLEALRGVTGLSTGLVDLDRMLAGLQPADLVILAARPAMGKTALALGIAQDVAARQRLPVALFSLEMGKGQLVTRMLCAEAQVDAQKARTGLLSRREDWPRLNEANERLYGAPLRIDDSAGLTLSQLRSRARRMKAREGLALLVIDYIQLLAGSGEVPREQQISAFSRGLKLLAKELEVPVLALSQLNRGCEARTDKRPLLSDLRESGAIEQDADVVMFIYRDAYYNPDGADPDCAEVIIAKQRNGPTGSVKLHFDGRFTRFSNLEQRR